MRVLFVCSGNSKSGISSFIKSQGESLRENGIDIDFYTIKGKGYRGYLENIFLLKKYLSQHSFDLIHAHYSLTAFVTTFALIGRSAPMVVSLMGSDTESNWLERGLIRIFYFLFWERLIVKSRSMYDKIKIKNALILPNGVNLRFIDKNFKHHQCLSKRLKVLFAADPSRESKNFQLAEKAFQFLKNEPLELNVTYNLSHEEIIEELHLTDIVLLTSRWEGSPNIIKEAMACNCVIVSTNVGDVEWVFGKTKGCYLTSHDPEDVAEKLIIAHNFVIVHGKTRGRDRIIELGLDSDTIAIRLKNTYTEILGNKN